MQITRQRVRPEMEINTREKCPTCGGTGEISPSILQIDRIENTLSEILLKTKLKKITLRLHPFIAAFITKGWIFTQTRKWEKEYKCKINVVPISSYDFLEYRFFDENGRQMVH